MGPRQLTQFTFKDYVLGVLVGSMGGRAMTRPEQAYITFLYGIVTVIIMQMLLSYLCLKSDRVRRFINGQPIIVISKGEILKNNLKKARLTMNELASLLRAESIFNLSDVEYAILEPVGNLSVLKKLQGQQITKSEMKIPLPVFKYIPSEIIVDGKVIYDNLKELNLNEDWLNVELNKQNISSIKDIFYAEIQSDGSLYIDKN
jgi:uncharacterized membrane protein YcaP (DUF421 family)